MNKELTYREAMMIGDVEDSVKNNIKDNYTSNYYGSTKNILGRFAQSMSKTSWKKVVNLSKKDTTLYSLVVEYDGLLMNINKHC